MPDTYLPSFASHSAYTFAHLPYWEQRRLLEEALEAPKGGDWMAAWLTISLAYDLGLKYADGLLAEALYTRLQHVRRFGDNPHIPLEGEDNSAIHPLLAALWAAEIFRRAGLYQPGGPVPEALKVSMLAMMWHEIGEIEQELNGAFERNLDASVLEDSEKERAIGEHAVRQTRQHLLEKYGITEAHYGFSVGAILRYFDYGNQRMGEDFLAQFIKLVDKTHGAHTVLRHGLQTTPYPAETKPHPRDEREEVRLLGFDITPNANAIKGTRYTEADISPQAPLRTDQEPSREKLTLCELAREPWQHALTRAMEHAVYQQNFIFIARGPHVVDTMLPAAPLPPQAPAAHQMAGYASQADAYFRALIQRRRAWHAPSDAPGAVSPVQTLAERIRERMEGPGFHR